ncbi:801_t:CDS:2 [Funneliformis mosseae]|uniref:801_t:CDS:1 n=1 Tax=Funneliformis mosseae TaxID=27381 RepID=A0A9N9B0U4_FUNMO|nr:801_t:CDS:2 [Funneliformis mosseae]
MVPFNCLLLGDTFDDIIKVNVGDKLKDDNNVEIDISEATVSDLKMLIRQELKGVFTEKDIDKLNGKNMGPSPMFRAEDNFPTSYKPPHYNKRNIEFPHQTSRKVLRNAKLTG